MLIGNHAAAAVITPFSRPPEFLRRQEQRRVFRIGRALHAERTADVIGENTHLCPIDTHDIGETASQTEDALARRVKGIAIADRIVLRNRGTRLHGRNMHAVVAQAKPGNMMGVGKGGIDSVAVSIFPIETGIPTRFTMKQRRVVLRRGDAVGHAGQFLHIEFNAFGGVTRLAQALGNDHCDRFTDITHPIDGKCRPRR